jgi:signal transduction histidine kinase
MSVELPSEDARARPKRRRPAAKGSPNPTHAATKAKRAASALEHDFEFTLDRHWRIVTITPMAAEWAGAQVADLLGRDTREIWSPPPQSVLDAVEAALERGATSSLTQPSLLVPGRWLKLDIGPAPEGVRFRFDDVTSQLMAEHTETVEAGKYSLGVGPAEICILDRSGTIVSTNSAWRAGLAAHGAAVANGGQGMAYAKVAKAVIAGLDEVEFQKRLETLLSGRVSQFEATYSLTRPHGQELRQVQIGPLRDGDRVYFAAIHEDLTERARILATLHETSDQLLHAQERERQRIARELHDSTSQHLAGIVMGLGQLRREVGRKAVALKRIDEIGRLAQQAIHETRVLSYLMNASGHESEGLTESIRRFVDGFGRRTGLEASFETEGRADTTSAATQHAVFRVVQEALTNVYRHAGASKASVRLVTRAGILTVQISDDGRGVQRFEGSEPPLGVGIPGMRARIEQLGGALRIVGDRSGTTVTATVPLRPNAARAAVEARRAS